MTAFKRKIFNYKQRHSFIKEIETGKPLLSIYKTLLRPDLYYCGVIYDKPLKEKFTDTVESFQYNAALAITGVIKGTSKEKLYNEFGLEYLKGRRWIRRLCLFHKIYHIKSPKYFYNQIPSVNHFYDTRNNISVSSFNSSTEYLRTLSFPMSKPNGQT